MVMAPSISGEHRWDPLQQPAHPSAVEPQYRLLLAALDLGWQIEEPVYLLPRFSDSGPRVYHFILRRPLASAPRLVTVPQTVEADAFVRDAGLRIAIHSA